MRNRTTYLAQLLTALMLPSAALPEEGPRPPPDTTTVLLERTSRLTAELTSDKKTAALKASFPAPNDDRLLYISVSGPFDEDTSQAVVGDLDRFASMANVETAYEWSLLESRQKLAISGRIGGRSFKYVDPVDLAKDTTDDHVSYGAAVTWSRFLERNRLFTRGALLGVRFRYDQVYEGQPDQEICTSIDATDNLRCRSIGAGAPQELDSAILQVQIAVPWKGLGISLLASHDLKSDETGLELPIYLTRDDTTGLFTGGIKVSWRSKEDDVRAILFIGVPIGTFE